MEIRELWTKTPTAGREAAICTAGGFSALVLALLLGAELGFALFFGIIVFAGLGTVVLWAWAQTNKKNGRAIGVDIGTVVMLGCGGAALFGALFFSDWLMHYGFWGLVIGLVVTVISAMSRHPEK